MRRGGSAYLGCRRSPPVRPREHRAAGARFVTILATSTNRQAWDSSVDTLGSSAGIYRTRLGPKRKKGQVCLRSKVRLGTSKHRCADRRCRRENASAKGHGATSQKRDVEWREKVSFSRGSNTLGRNRRSILYRIRNGNAATSRRYPGVATDE